MNKNIWLVVIILLLSLLGVFLYTNPTPYTEISFLKKEMQKKLPPPVPIVKDIQLDHLIVKDSPQEGLKKDLRKAKINVEKRKIVCEENSKGKFTYLKKDMANELTLVFDKTLARKESGQAFLKIQELLNSDVPIDLNIYYSLLSSLEICRSKKSLDFLDRAINYLKDGDQKYQDEISPILINNIKDNLLGDQYSPINLSLVFGKLGRLISMNAILDPYAGEIINLKNHFLTYEKEVNRNIKRAKGQDQLRDLTIEHFSELKEISVELKSILENI